MPNETFENPADPAGTGDLIRAADMVAKPRFQYAATPQEDMLARSYALHHNAGQAYNEANYPKLASVAAMVAAAYRLIQTERVQERLRYYQELISAKRDLREDRVLGEMAAIAMSDPLDFFDHEGNVRPLHEIPPHARAAIQKFNIKKTEDVLVDGTVRTRVNVDISTWDKVKALDQIARIKGLYHDPVREAPPTVVIDMSKIEQIPPGREESTDDGADFLC